MTSQYIESLLNKFWEAETSLEEEMALKTYFNGSNIDESLAYAAPFFWNQPDNEKSKNDITLKLVQKLLDKYYRAETTLEEEALIKEYFHLAHGYASFPADGAIFRSFAAMNNVQYSKPLFKKDTFKSTSNIVSLKWLKSVAAAIVLLIGAYFLVKINTKSEGEQTFSKATIIEPNDPEEAYAYTLKALAMVSDKYKKGEDQLLHGMRTINDAKNPNN